MCKRDSVTRKIGHSCHISALDFNYKDLYLVLDLQLILFLKRYDFYTVAFLQYV